MNLHRYQIEGVHRLVRGNLLLTDEMGLGKTVQVAVALRWLKPKRCLIVCPKSMINTWLEELEKWYPGGGFERWKSLHLPAENPVVRLVTNYENVPMESLSWDILVVDEAHKIKNRKAMRSISVRLNAKKCEKVWLLTGTPILNSVEEIWHLAWLIDRKAFSSRWRFIEEWCNTGLSSWSHSGIKVLPGVKQGREEEFARMLAPYMLRRTKVDVGLQLPPVTVQEHWLDMTELQALYHRGCMTELKIGIETLEPLTIKNMLTRTLYARRCAVSPMCLGVGEGGAKFEALADLLEGCDDRVVVFSQWKDPLFKFVDQYMKCGGANTGYKRNCYFLHGDMSEVARTKEINSWKTSKVPGVLFATLGTGGVGLTLTESATAIFLDESWVPAETEQAIARLNRIGQTRPITVHKLICKKSIEETVYKVLGNKQAMIDRINEEIARL